MAAASDPESGGRPLHAVDGDRRTCWLCRCGVPDQALFCPRCGAVLPGEALDPFALFGLEARFDLDSDALARHHATLQRMLTPERLAVKSPPERQVAQDLNRRLTDAYETLRDPLRRARCLLARAGLGAGAPMVGPAAPALPEADQSPQSHGGPPSERLPLDTPSLDAAVAEAADGATLDRLAHLALHEMTLRLHTLAVAFRAGRLGEAQAILSRLDALEAASVSLRARRGALQVHSPGSTHHSASPPVAAG